MVVSVCNNFFDGELACTPYVEGPQHQAAAEPPVLIAERLIIPWDAGYRPKRNLSEAEIGRCTSLWLDAEKITHVSHMLIATNIATTALLLGSMANGIYGSPKLDKDKDLKAQLNNLKSNLNDFELALYAFSADIVVRFFSMRALANAKYAQLQYLLECEEPDILTSPKQAHSATPAEAPSDTTRRAVSFNDGTEPAVDTGDTLLKGRPLRDVEDVRNEPADSPHATGLPRQAPTGPAFPDTIGFPSDGDEQRVALEPKKPLVTFGDKPAVKFGLATILAAGLAVLIFKNPMALQTINSVSPTAMPARRPDGSTVMVEWL